MRWKTKALIQNALSLLPSRLSYAAYYRMQRRFGGFKNWSPLDRLAAAVQTWRLIEKQGIEPRGRVFFEVGTGWIPLLPICYWLMGAERTITVDVNPYLKTALVREVIRFMGANEGLVVSTFGDLLQQDRLRELLRGQTERATWLPWLLELCHIDYRCPCDAGDTGLPACSVDFHTSYTVLEHIPPTTLGRILSEGNRILKSDGLSVHMIDYSDHFSHSDSSISALNFLRYSEDEWSRYAGNRFMYVNRLRHDDMLKLFERAGQEIVTLVPYTDETARQALESNTLPLDRRFSGKPDEVLAIRGAWVVGRCSPQRGAIELS